jgi:hypothetical protein
MFEFKLVDKHSSRQLFRQTIPLMNPDFSGQISNSVLLSKGQFLRENACLKILWPFRLYICIHS